MNKLASLLTGLALLAASAVSFATDWTSVCSAGATIDETSLSIYQVAGSYLAHRSGTTGTITARYNVTNTAVPSTPTPPWTIFELGYFDNAAAGSVTATLYETDPCTGKSTVICRINSIDASGARCLPCQFASTTFDFTNNLYYVQVDVFRSNPDVTPRAITLRIY